MPRSGIYQIRNLATDMRYVGQSVHIDRRLARERSELRHNKHHNRHLQRSWNKHGESAFIFEPLAAIDPALLALFEQRAFNALNPKYGCYNQGPCMENPMTGQKRGPHTAETRSKMSRALVGRTLSFEHRHKLSEAHRGKKPSEETRHKMSIAMSSRILTDEHRRRIGIANKGRHLSDEHRRKLSIWQKGRKRGPHTDETRRKLSVAAKRQWALRRRAAIMSAPEYSGLTTN